jgi:hypothetical protein
MSSVRAFHPVAPKRRFVGYNTEDKMLFLSKTRTEKLTRVPAQAIHFPHNYFHKKSARIVKIVATWT